MNYVYVNGLPNEDAIKGIQKLHREVFDGDELSINELKEKTNLLCCIALDEHIMTGFKLGYEK
ncbi:hypothetical protein ACWV26_18650 [Rummeliibacillus sp. JY-2-4R]